jgi:hypothetical protein
MIQCVVAHGGEERKILKQQNILCNNFFFAVNEVLSKALTKTHIFFRALGTPTRVID